LVWGFPSAVWFVHIICLICSCSQKRSENILELYVPKIVNTFFWLLVFYLEPHWRHSCHNRAFLHFEISHKLNVLLNFHQILSGTPLNLHPELSDGPVPIPFSSKTLMTDRIRFYGISLRFCVCLFFAISFNISELPSRFVFHLGMHHFIK